MSSCRNCHFWRGYGADVSGTCVASPPTPVRTLDEEGKVTTISVWPETEADDACGMWKQRKGLQENVSTMVTKSR
jgi:hypothetical protein